MKDSPAQSLSNVHGSYKTVEKEQALHKLDAMQVSILQLLWYVRKGSRVFLYYAT